MIEIGRYNTLRVHRIVPNGVRLGTDEHNILLPSRYVPRDCDEGEWLEVFVYTDSEDEPIATTLHPLATVGQFAFLKVVDVTPHGAFLDWGLPKDLFAPNARQFRPMRVGDHVVVGLSLHERTERVIASSTLKGLFDDDVQHLSPGQPVGLLVYGFNDLGAQVIVQGRHAGLVFHDQLFRRVRIGDRLDGFVDRVREDCRLDIVLRRAGRDGNADAEETILNALRRADGHLDLHDKSPPQEIKARLGLSKKAFKRALGSLYRARRVVLVDGGVRQVDE